MAVIQSANKKNQQENTETKSHADEAAHTGKRTYLRDSPFKKKKMYTPAGLFLPSFWSVCVFPSGIPLGIVFLVSFPLFSHK